MALISGLKCNREISDTVRNVRIVDTKSKITDPQKNQNY